MTRPVMGNKSNPALTRSFLLMAALYLKGFITEGNVYSPAERMSWTEARLYCQKNHVDLVTWNQVHRLKLAERLAKIGATHVWIGLLRDAENSTAWKWINLKTGKGVSGDDISQSSNSSTGQQNNYCAVVSAKDHMWYSDRCSSGNNFYCSVGDTIQYHNKILNWYEASQFCQVENGELATINQTNADYFDKGGWIGLYQEATTRWSWIRDFPSSYRNWAPGEPPTADCGSFDSATKKWYSQVCSRKLRPACYDDEMVVVKMNETWEGAMVHCRNMETPCVDSMGLCKYRHRLLHLTSKSNYNYVRDRLYGATTDEVWTGLRFLGGEWWWENGLKIEDQQLLPDCPAQRKHCGTLSKYDTNKWIVRDCSERRNFICFKRKVFVAIWKRNVNVSEENNN